MCKFLSANNPVCAIIQTVATGRAACACAIFNAYVEIPNELMVEDDGKYGYFFYK